jgi:cell cycle sensor histidine kinase DivJ
VAGTVSFLTPIWNYVDALTPVAVQKDALAVARCRAFIAPRLLGSVVVLASRPVYLVLRGAPSGAEVAVFSWIVLPILIVRYLSRTAHYEAAHILSSASLTGLVFFIAFLTGGVDSFAALWLIVVPFEAALSGSRRVVLIAAAFSTGAGLLLLLLDVAAVLSRAASSNMHVGLAVFVTILASLYTTSLALGIVSLARTGEQLLNKEEDRYRLLSQNAIDGIIRCGRGGAVLFASPATEILFGVPAGELAGDGLFDRVHVADRPAFLAALADAAESVEERLLEFRIRRDAGTNRPGRVVWVEMRCRSLGRVHGGQGRPDVVAILQDISERKAQEEAIESARLESERRSIVVATMSHELRTPLNAIIGFSEILTSGALKMPAAQIEYAKLINESGRHLLCVVNNLLDASMIESGHFRFTQESFAPGPEISRAVDLLALQAREAGVELELRLAQNLPDIVADRRAISQILINLISNAVKFTPHGGLVTVSASGDGPKLLMTIEDSGVGIGQDDLPRLGEAFFQARSPDNRRHEGSGLGLSIVKGLVKLHDGVIDIRSRPGEGTRVTVRLPLRGGRDAVEPIKLMVGSTPSNPDSSKEWTKKSA